MQLIDLKKKFVNVLNFWLLKCCKIYLILNEVPCFLVGVVVNLGFVETFIQNFFQISAFHVCWHTDADFDKENEYQKDRKLKKWKKGKKFVVQVRIWSQTYQKNHAWAFFYSTTAAEESDDENDAADHHQSNRRWPKCLT